MSTSVFVFRSNVIALLLTMFLTPISYAKDAKSVEVTNKATDIQSTLLAVKSMDIADKQSACNPSICPLGNVYSEYTLLQVNESRKFAGAQCLCVTYSPYLSWSGVQTYFLQPGQKLSLVSEPNGSRPEFHYVVN